MNRIVRNAIFPVAGLGTRMMPATNAVPKELLPVLDKPLIDFAIDEAVTAGAERLIFVSNPEKPAIERHVRSTMAAHNGPEIVFVEQKQQLGLGHAVLMARTAVLPGPCAVILPDDLILGSESCLREMVKIYQRLAAGHLVATMQVSRDLVGRYGILSIKDDRGGVAFADGVIEKPMPDQAPSTEAVVGRYILEEAIFAALANQKPGTGGEIQLTDAIAQSSQKLGLAGWRFKGTRYDCGSKDGLLSATISRAKEDPLYDHVWTSLADSHAERAA